MSDAYDQSIVWNPGLTKISMLILGSEGFSVNTVAPLQY